MTDEGDADDGLKSLRAVWLSMPDEDPPERGFAELMAAARVKAEEMARPSLWERVVATLRRPPVLALASVAVLIGGAVMIGTRKSADELAVQPAAEQAVSDRSPTANATPTAAAPGAAPVAQPPAAPAGPADDGDDVVVGGMLRDEASKQVPKQEPKKESSAPAPKREATRAPMKTATTSTTSTAPTSGASRDRAKLDAANAELKKQSQGAGIDLMRGHNPEEGLTREAMNIPPPPPPPPPSASNLHGRARQAMTRGDCETVRALARQIQSLDPAYFKTRVEKDSALSGCLAN